MKSARVVPLAWLAGARSGAAGPPNLNNPNDRSSRYTRYDPYLFSPDGEGPMTRTFWRWTWVVLALFGVPGPLIAQPTDRPSDDWRARPIVHDAGHTPAAATDSPRAAGSSAGVGSLTTVPRTVIDATPTRWIPAAAEDKSGPAGSATSPPKPPETADGPVAGSKPAPSVDLFPVQFKFKPGDNNLLQMEAANGLFKFYAGGRLQIDAVWLRADDQVARPRDVGGIGRVDDATNFRRARFDFGGTFYKNIDFLMEWDFINTFNAERDGAPLPANTPVPTDLWVTFKEVPYVNNVRIGNQKPPIGFEHMTSSRFLNFLERSFAFDGFIENQNNGFEMGVSAFDTFMDDHGTWHVGVFKNTRNIFGWNVGDGEYDVTGRVTFLPIYENDGEFLVHVGVGASHRDFDDDQDRIRSRLLLRNGPAVLHNILAEARYLGDFRDQVVPEFVVVWGPWTFQSEYFAVWVKDAATPVDGGPRTNHGKVFFQGANAEILYFLSGEHQRYNRKTAAFGRTIPRADFHAWRELAEGETCEWGIGAWQVGARYSWLDLDSKGINGGTVHDLTLGLNWFLNPYMKWQWNYICEYRNAPNPAFDGWIHGFGTRIAFDF
jgi:phosphate-selective porin OprO/OprP